MLNAYPAAFGCHTSKTAYKRRAQRLPAMVNSCIFKSDVSRRKGERLQNYLRDQGLPRYTRKVGRSASVRRAFNFSVRRTYRELNETPKRSSEESAIRDFTVCRYPLCVSLADTNVAIKTTTTWPDKNYVV